MTFVEQIAPWAVESEREHGIPAAVTIAQAILESGRGTSELAVRAQALFGIKYSAAWAASSPGMRSATGSHFREERPRRMAMLARWAMVMVRWAASMGAAVGLRWRMPSMKLA